MTEVVPPPSQSPKIDRTRMRRMALLFALAVAVRIIYFFALLPYDQNFTYQGIQRNDFLAIAKHVANGEGFSSRTLLTYYDAGRLVPTAARAPLPVLVFAAIVFVVGSHWYYPILALMWCCSGIVAATTYWIALRVSGREWLAMWTGLVFAFYGSEMLVMTTYAAASEPLFTVLMALYLALLICAVDRRSVGLAAATGLVLGLATLTRPTVLYLPAVSIGWIFFQHRARGVAMAVALVVACAVPQIPWVVRNDQVFGVPLVTTTLGGFNIYRHNGIIEEGKYNPGYTHEEFEPKVRRLARSTGRPLESFTETELNALLYKEGTRIIRTYPLRYLKLSALRTVWIWYNENSGKGLYAVQNLLIYLLAAGGLFYVFRSREPLYYLLLAHIAYFVAIHSAINVQYRFICPMMPYMILLAGLPVYAWWTARSQPETVAVSTARR
jgi:hypothetical protein